MLEAKFTTSKPILMNQCTISTIKKVVHLKNSQLVLDTGRSVRVEKNDSGQVADAALRTQMKQVVTKAITAY